MHESSLGRQIVNAVLAKSAEAHAGRIRVVRGWVAETETLSIDAITFHFNAHARGTPAEGARLELHVAHVQAGCRGCGETYAPEHHLLLCPHCGSTDGVVLGKTGLGIDDLDADSA